VRKLARDLGIELTRVKGSERGGRITVKDLRNYIVTLQKMVWEKQDEKAREPTAKQIDFSKWGPIRKSPMSLLRQTVAERMRDSWSTIPHVTQFDEADISWFAELKKKIGPKGRIPSLTCFVIQAVLKVLRKYPVFNSSLEESSGEIVYKDYYHFGIAVDTEAGLMAPVIRDVDKKELWDLSVELERLVERTRQRKVALEELDGATFTISNQGTIGGAHFTPIIPKPEVAILGLGRGLSKPVTRDESVEIRMLLPLSLSYDHRVIDGADAARFMLELVRALENFAGEIEGLARKV
jgi:pyruvate dehydrogenase E2 component (dihydrolipoamide acetyltransferase)